MMDCFKCCALSMLAGVIVGGVLVVSNKKVESGFKKGTEVAMERFEEIKESIEEKTKKQSKSSK
ncbi:MAG: hypothetical protein IJW24_01700 [Clostridia bacterium]|nr:hypothetical protein [Clostridia bacterium]